MNDLPHSVYSATFDRCSVDRFDRYRLVFRRVRLSLVTVNLLLVSMATVVQGLETGEVLDGDASTSLKWQNVLTLVSGVSALILRGVEQTIGLAQAETQCDTAHADLAYYLSTKRSMPFHVHDRILRTNTLWYPSPKTCVS